MSKQAIIDRTVKAITLLPKEKAEVISDFVDFMFKRHEETLISDGIKNIVSESSAFNFLEEEEDLYTIADLKEVYNG